LQAKPLSNTGFRLSKKIKVFVHSYKNKKLFDFCDSVLDKANNEITLYIYDKVNAGRFTRYSKRRDVHNVTYYHINWENRHHRAHFRNRLLYGDFDYFLSISDNVILTNGWDDKCIKAIDNNTVLSGAGIPKLNINKFFIEEAWEHSTQSTISCWVDKDFIFLPRDLTPLIHHSYDVVDYIEAPQLTLALNKNNITIKSLPSSVYTKNTLIKMEYDPCSKYHGHNSFVKRLNAGEFDTKMFNDFHNIKIENMKELPFETDDVPYKKPKLNVGQGYETRFHYELHELRP
jgi:hypothetical protein